MHRAGLFFAVVLLSTTTLFGASQKTPWGDPDLQGIWSNQSPTPLERLEALAGKTTLTEQEAAEFERTSLERLLTTFAREVPISGELNEIWLETAKGKVPPGRSTSLVEMSSARCPSPVGTTATVARRSNATTSPTAPRSASTTAG